MPTYRQIEQRLRARVLGGDWPTGSMLPSRRDLAREYGVSPITIERAITPLLHEGILRADDRRGTFVADLAVVAAPRMEVAVAAGAAKQQHFRHAPHFVGPQHTRAATIGIIASLYVFNHDHLKLNNVWVTAMVEAIEQALAHHGHRTRFFNRVRDPQDSPLPIGSAIREALDERVDALALVGFGWPSETVDDSLRVLDGIETPVVCITSDQLRRPVPHVFLDNRSAGYQAAVQLIQAGCRDIVFLAPFTASWARERMDGAASAVALAGLPESALSLFPESAPEFVQEQDPIVVGRDTGRRLLATGRRPGGVIGVNDGVALGYLEAAAEYGLQAGRDFAAVGFDDHPEARAVQLTSLRPPMAEMGIEASRLIMDALAGNASHLQVRLKWQLIPRMSCGPAPHASQVREPAGAGAAELD